MGIAARYFIFKLPSLLSTRLRSRHDIIGVRRLSADYKMVEEPNIKRAKMDNPNEKKDSTSLKSSKNEPKLIIDTSTQDFSKIRNMSGFVDHTHFIKVFISLKGLAIFAPRRFGKSSHLDMVHKFLQIDVDETTGCASSSVNGPAKERKNYKLFEGTRIVTDYKNLVEEHLGKHPVIRLDFKGGEIDSVESAKMHCREVVHKAYKEHSYLITSKKLVKGGEDLNATGRRVCKKWCDAELYQKQGEQDLRVSLGNLARYLYNHFDGAKVYILVDEFDAINASALRNIPNDAEKVSKLLRICNFLEYLLGSVTKGCNIVNGSLFTGVSHIVGTCPNLNNIINMHFLDDHYLGIKDDTNLVPFYGATAKEVESLILKLVENKELPKFENQKEFLNDSNELDPKKIMDVVQSRYNGYFNKSGERIFCLWSVLQYLQNGIAENYWKSADDINNLYMMLESSVILHEIIKLMRSEMIRLKRFHQMFINELEEFYNLLAAANQINVDTEEIYSDAAFNFLIDQGFLTYPEGGALNGKYQLPNAEIRAALSDMIGKIVIDRWECSTTTCTDLINDFSLSLVKDKKKLQDKMLDIHKAISLIINSPKRVNPLQLNEDKISCIMYKALNDADSFELFVDLPVKDENGKYITGHRPDFVLHHKKDKQLFLLWEIRYAADSKNKKKTSLYALQEARGIVDTENYLDSFKELGRKALVIGLSINEEMKVSLSYAFGMEEKIYVISETEATSFSNFYKKYDIELVHLKENEKKVIETL